ncbi:MarC family protein [Propionivibrio sp.]|uniref:MarC family protein n=1 Tax=Propionivibrio sp. TaxID=2212460 RepID=UPI003BF450E5
MQEQSFQHYLLGLIAVANNIPAIPLYLALCKGRSVAEQHRLCFVASLTSFITMMVAMLTGMTILNFFEISIDAFRMAGGLLLLNTGLGMMNSSQEAVVIETDDSFARILSTAIIPISIPLTTGAGTMSTVILFTQGINHSETLEAKLLGAIVCMTILIYVSFRYSPIIIRILKDTGMDVLTKVFGLITLALGIQFILSGIKGAFPKFV